MRAATRPGRPQDWFADPHGSEKHSGDMFTRVAARALAGTLLGSGARVAQLSRGTSMGGETAPATAAAIARRSLQRRGLSTESASKAGAEEQGIMATVVDTVSTMGTAVGCLVGATIGVSYYTHSTKQLEEALEKGEHVPGALKDTPLKQALDYAFGHLLEFRQWADGLRHQYLDPVSDKLLPDHPPNAVYIPHTLVLDLDECLIKSDWRRERGWRTFKRPGAGDFIKHMAQFYEVIVFSDQTSMYVDPILERLDPQRFLAGRLAREANQYVDGEYLRDLTKLNRDVGMILYITARPKTSMQQENVVQISPYIVDSEGRTAGGDGPDTTLLDLMPFLESIVRLNVKDVREVLASYKQEQEATGKSVPEIFRSRQYRFQKQQRQKTVTKPAFSRGW